MSEIEQACKRVGFATAQGVVATLIREAVESGAYSHEQCRAMNDIGSQMIRLHFPQEPEA